MAPDPIRDLDVLLASLQAVRVPGIYVFCSMPPGADRSVPSAIATFREREGLTVILEEDAAVIAQLRPVYRAAWITLTVHSDLHAVGLTAAVSSALAAEGISANIVAAVHHDHLFVPLERADDAIAVLDRLQAAARRRDTTL